MFDIIAIGEKITSHVAVWHEVVQEVDGVNYDLIDNCTNGAAVRMPSEITDIFVTAKEPTKAVLYSSRDKEIIKKIELKYEIIKLLVVTNTAKVSQFVAVCRQNMDIVIVGVKVGNNAVKKTILATVKAENKNIEGEFSAATAKISAYAHTTIASNWGQFIGASAMLSAEASSIMYAGFYTEAECEIMDEQFNAPPPSWRHPGTNRKEPAVIFLKSIDIAFGACSIENLPGLVVPYEGSCETSSYMYRATGSQFKKFVSYRGVVAGLFGTDFIVFFNREHGNPCSIIKSKSTLISFNGSDICDFCFNKDKLITVVNHNQICIYEGFNAFYVEKCKALIAEIKAAEELVEAVELKEEEENKIISTESVKLYNAKVVGDIANCKAVELPIASFVLELENINDRIYMVKCFNNGAHTLIVFAVSNADCNYDLYGVRDGMRIFKHTFKDRIIDVDYNVTNVARGSHVRGRPALASHGFTLSELVSVVLKAKTDSIFRFIVTNDNNNASCIRDMRPNASVSDQLHSQMARSLDI